MKASIPHRIYLGWQKYWDVEPWGQWRDNVHAGIIAREIRGMRGGKSSIDTFMVRNPEDRQAVARDKTVSALAAVATKVTPIEAYRRIRAQRQKRGKRKAS